MIAALTLAAALTITPTARAMQPGEVVRLDIVAPVAVTAVKAHAFNTDLTGYQVDAADPRHWRVLVGIDLDATLGKHPVSVMATTADGKIDGSYTITVVAKKFPTRRLTVDPNFVDPPADAMPRITAEQKEQQAIWAAPAPERLWTGAFIRPVPQPANSAFGTRSVFNNQPRGSHTGADFLSPAGQAIKAPAGGRVVLAKDTYFSGGTVIIDHGLGLFSFFAHMSKIDAKVGDVVKPGDIVGLVGATGRVTGAHLHWTVRLNGARVDPLSLIDVLAR